MIRAVGPLAWVVVIHVYGSPAASTRSVTASTRTLANDLGLSKDTCARALRTLRTAGLINVDATRAEHWPLRHRPLPAPRATQARTYTDDPSPRRQATAASRTLDASSPAHRTLRAADAARLRLKAMSAHSPRQQPKKTKKLHTLALQVPVDHRRMLDAATEKGCCRSARNARHIGSFRWKPRNGCRRRRMAHRSPLEGETRWRVAATQSLDRCPVAPTGHGRVRQDSLPGRSLG